MPDSKATLSVSARDDKLVCKVAVHDHDLLGKPAKLKLVRTVDVADSEGISASDQFDIAEIAQLEARHEFEVSRESLKAFTYRGKAISIRIAIRLAIDDGMIYDTKIDESIELAIGSKPSVSDNAQGLVEPDDAFSFATNFKAIPHVNRAITIALVLVGGIVITVNSLIAWHDENAARGTAFIYSKYDSDGKKRSPLLESLVGSGTAGVMVAAAIKTQLRKYMRFDLKKRPGTIRFGDRIPVRDLVTGRSRIELKDIVVRIVACNFEKGQYTRGSGSQQRTVSFSQPVRAVVLYEKKIASVPPKKAIENELDGEIDFSPMFQALYPPQNVSSTHGLTVHWEMQLIHDELVDQEVVCPSEVFEWEDFRKS